MNIIRSIAQSYIDSVLKEGIATDEDKSSQTTQLTAGTDKTVNSSLEEAKKHGLEPHHEVLHYGSGRIQNEQLNHPVKHVKNYEPFPDSKDKKPDYSDSDNVPKKHFDHIESHNVLNVVREKTRHQIYDHMFNSVKDGGTIHASGRPWKGDLEAQSKSKNSRPGPEHESIIVSKKRKNPETGKSETHEVFHKGVAHHVLAKEFQDAADRHGHQVEISKVGKFTRVKLLKRGNK